MGDSVATKILKAHLVEGELTPGEEIALRIDQTLTQDATGTLAFLQFEAMGIPRVKTELSVSYVDHNMLQSDFRNADDHMYLQSVAAKHGVYFSRPGNGICHQVHLERFGAPGKTLLGSDSHTPTGGGLGMVAMGAGGLDVAVAMGGGPFYTPCPKIVGVKLTGCLKPWVASKDIILEMLKRLTAKGGFGKIIEYYGPGIDCLDVPARATVCNMGAELGATCSLFPSDHHTKEFLEAMGRGECWTELLPDADAHYDEHIEINLSELVPLVAQPHNPDKVVPVSEVAGLKLNQVCVGSCTNSSYHDLALCALVLRDQVVAPNVSMTLTPGSKNVFNQIAADGMLTDIIAAGARVLESACGPCIGMGQAPPSQGVSLRTFNRNFVGRSGTKDALVYLCSPEVAVVSAIRGVLTDPREFGAMPEVKMPAQYIVDDRMIIPPADDPAGVEVVRGPNIIPLEPLTAMPDRLECEVILKTEDNISTDHIMPAGAKVLPFRSNIPKISEFVYATVDETFHDRALKLRETGGSAIIGGSNYGQGSSREHAGLAPRFLGTKFKIVKDFARIHKANLINFGILPLLFKDPADYDKISQGDRLVIDNVRAQLKDQDEITVQNLTQGTAITALLQLSARDRAILLAGGKLNYTREQAQG
ncbi:aconitate hydratase [bacterium]|nr:aconitate hydratase [bacterium]